MNKKELYDISILGAIGITLVVFGHSLPSRFLYDETYVPFLTNIIDFIYIFHMPLFFYISGYLWRFTQKYDFSDELKSKIKRLLMPYFLFSCLGYIVKWPLSQYAGRPINFGFEDFFFRIFFPWESPIIFLWFLPCLFLVSITSILLLKFIFTLFAQIKIKNDFLKKRLLFITISIIVILFFRLTVEFEYRSQEADLFNLTGVAYHLPFYILGFLVGNYGRDRILYSLSVLFFIFLVCVFFGLITIIRIEAVFIILILHLLVLILMKSIYMEANFIRVIYKNNMAIYLLSFFFQVPVGFLIIYFTKNPIYMIVISFLIGGIGPILARKFLLKIPSAHKFIKLVGL